jgi:hypothetical protein
MKPWERSVSSPDAPTRERPVTTEIEGDEPPPVRAVEPPTSPGARPRFGGNILKTVEIDVRRDRRATISSPIPAAIAETMLAPRSSPRDPAAPECDPEPPEPTRRVGDSDRQSATAGSGPLGDATVAARRQRAALRIDEARSALDAGELTEAVLAAEAALTESDEAGPPGIVEVIEPARPLLTRVFATYVGSPPGGPVLAPRAFDIALCLLGEAERALLGRVDGIRTLEELFDGSGLGSLDALRIAARLIRSGAIRVV